MEKTGSIKIAGGSLHKKSKKLNSWWHNFACFGCGGSNSMSRGASIKGMSIARKANKKSGELGLL